MDNSKNIERKLDYIFKAIKSGQMVKLGKFDDVANKINQHRVKTGNINSDILNRVNSILREIDNSPRYSVEYRKDVEKILEPELQQKEDETPTIPEKSMTRVMSSFYSVLAHHMLPESH